ncbi:hypothetical protein C8Q80DRAFT_1139817 [Daedaleopsis nitida]|nr:hypothetical protein C8Q80DRAFT_1139817 [Daedaleopsis nitida]
MVWSLCVRGWAITSSSVVVAPEVLAGRSVDGASDGAMVSPRTAGARIALVEYIGVRGFGPDILNLRPCMLEPIIECRGRR